MSDETSTIVVLGRPAPAGRTGRIAPRLAGRLPHLSLSGILEIERDRLFLWAPIAFGTGIAVYFALPREPALGVVAALCAITGLAALRGRRPGMSGTVLVALFLAALGLTDAALRSRRVAAPVVAASEVPVPVTGRVSSLEWREDGAARLMIEPGSVGAMPPEALPRTLALWMRGKWPVPAPGDTVRFNAVLMPPPDAVIPGGFDYARTAWFAGIGGVGFITGPPQPVAPQAEAGLLKRLAAANQRLRLAIDARIRAAVPGPTGTIASALVTGLRGAIPEADDEALRASGLAHVLSISGLHMVLVVGTLFWVVRAALALSARLALTRPIKKWAAAFALAGGAGYLVLSGAEVATQRAFIMTAVMMLAILIDRPAITLRNVAVAALVVLALSPEALMSASFQMSFAATVALVAAYEALRDGRMGRAETAMSPAVRYLWRSFFGMVLTSLVAGLATAPFGAYHFNRVAMYGLVANVAAMPLVGVLVMPAGLAAVFLMPFGLEGPPLAVMGLGIDGMLRVSETVAGWDGAVRTVPRMPAAALLAMTAGGLWLCLWRSPLRLAGVPVVVAGVAMTALAPAPDLFVSRDAGIAALRLEDGSLVFLPRTGSGYQADVWTRSIGIAPDTPDARAPPRATCDRHACIADSGRLRVSHVSDPSAFEEDCGWADVVVTRLDPPAWCGRDALVIGPREAERWGATTLRRTQGGLVVETAAGRSGDRPWTRRAAGRPDAAR